MKRFVEILNEAFSIPELNTYIGNDVITGINDLSLQLDKTSLSKLIFFREKYEFFKKKKLEKKFV